MHPLAQRALRTIRRRALLPRDGRVVAAVSGGADSVALAHLLRELAEAGELALVGLAHLNHRLRGDAADADERFCRDLAVWLARPIEVEAIDVRVLARERRTSVEDAGRLARSAFFERAGAHFGADRVAVAHTRDDQAETFLLRVLRGAGPRGLAGIYPRAGVVIRPLLDVSRDELRGYLRARGLAFREDESNRDLSIPRNRVRHELLPLIREHLSPRVVDVLARTAAIARADADWLDCAADAAARGIVRRVGDGVEFDAAALVALHPALAWRVTRQAMRDVSHGRFVGFDHVEAVMELVRPEAETSGQVDLPGHRAVRAGARLVLAPREADRGVRKARVNFFSYPLSIPGEARVEGDSVVVSAEEMARPDAAGILNRLRGRDDWTAVAAAALARPLAVRNRRPGDAFRPLGLGGRKKLQDFFVDRKVPRRERDTVLLVVDAHDRIVWVVGHAVADDFRVTDPTAGVVILRVERAGGAA